MIAPVLELDYEKHPSFNLLNLPYSVQLSKIESFDTIYKKLKFAYEMSDLDYRAHKNELEALIFEVFEEMRMQCKDEFETCFFEELEFEAVRLLNVECTYYRNIDKKKYHVNEYGVSSEFESKRCYFGVLTESTIRQIIDATKSAVENLRENAANGKLTREDLSVNQGPVVAKIVKILNSEFGSVGILDMVSQYMGSKYQVGGLAIELSVPNARWWKNTMDCVEDPKTMYAHLDEAINYPKSIVYISNVDQSHGPTTCYLQAYERLQLNALQELIGRIVGSVGASKNSKLNAYYTRAYHQPMSSELFRRHFMMLPRELRFNSHFGWDVIPNSDFENELLACKKELIGKAGSFVVFDGGRLLHRGGLIESEERIALQVIFTPVPKLAQKLRIFPHKVIRKLKRILG
jgi:hypothetical protein